MTSALTGQTEKKTQRDGEESHVETEAETGTMLPQTKEHQKPPESGRGKKQSPLEPSEGAGLC